MNRNLYIGFKGKNNASCLLVQSISTNHCLLTNSFDGLKKDIEQLDDFYNCIIMFGIDKNLKDSVRIEKVAEKGTLEHSCLNLEEISANLNANGITNYICDKPTHYLCNEAYWYILHKFNGRAAFIHIPSIKYKNDIFIQKMKLALG